MHIISELDQRVAIPGGGMSITSSFCKLSTDRHKQTALSKQLQKHGQKSADRACMNLAPFVYSSCIP